VLETHQCDELIKAANPLTDQRSEAEIDAALERVVQTLPAADKPLTRRSRPARPRPVFAGAVVAAAIVIAFAATNLISTSGSPGGVSVAWAKQVITRVAAVLAGSGNGILHIDETIVETSTGRRAGSRVRSFEFNSWQQQTPPYAYWQNGYNGADHSTTVITNRIERYDTTGNTLYEGRKLSPSAISLHEQIANPAWLAVSYMAQRVRVPSNATSYGVLLAQLLKAPGVAVNPHVRLNGKTVIGIVSGVTRGISLTRAGDISGTLYVQPKTYRPLEYVIRRGNGIVTQRFSTYQTLPLDSVPVPNLQKLHPDARIIRGTD
jgi:hypothetical protein